MSTLVRNSGEGRIIMLGTIGATLLLAIAVGGIWFLTTQPLVSESRAEGSMFVDSNRLKKHVRALSESFGPRDYTHPENLDRTAAYIRNEFQQTGGTVTDQVYRAKFDPAHDKAAFASDSDLNAKTYRNVIVSFGPETNERIVVGAHYDSFGGLPAADDNASGVAGLIELAYLLGKATLPLRVELVAYTLEEPMTIAGHGLFRSVGGSEVHAESLRKKGVTVPMMLSLEMIGYYRDEPGSQRYPSRLFRLFYPSEGNFVLAVGRVRDGLLARRIKKAMRSATSLPVYSLNAPASLEGIDWSDHYSYWENGYPALMITDTLPRRSNNYHTANDTANVLDYNRMAMMVEGVYAAVLQLANSESKDSPMNETTKYFSTDYFQARTRFRDAVDRARGQLFTLPIDAKGPNGEELAIDIGWVGPQNPKKVWLHSSGIHGVEGFAGSAIQLELLENLPKLPDDTAVVFVHILNPYGMAWLRRFNENNVDLNRNFLGPDEKYSGAPEMYAQLNSFLNPSSPPHWDFFLLRAGIVIVRATMANLFRPMDGYNAAKQAVAGGQYEYPKGLFFGGKELQNGPRQFHEFLAKNLAGVEKLVAIDVHTGLGKYAEDSLLVEKNDFPYLKSVFGVRVIPSDPDESPAYRIRGAMVMMLPRLFPKATVAAVTQEFGTYRQINVLHAVREENRWHHYGSGALEHSAKQRLKVVFYPDDDAWRKRVLQRGRELFNQAREFLATGPSDPSTDLRHEEADLFHRRGREAGSRGDYKNAIVAFGQASRLAPHWAYPVYDMAFTYMLLKDFENARKYYRKTLELEPRGFFTAITALDSLERETKGELPNGTYLAYVSLEWITDPVEKAAAARDLADKVPGFAPVWKEIALSLKEDALRFQAIEKGLAAKPDAETKGVLLSNKALILDHQGHHDDAVQLLEEILRDPQLPSGPEEMTRLILKQVTRK